jgi:hypothetical protein
VGIGMVIYLTVITFISNGIASNYEKIKERKATNKSTINTARNGYVELVVNIQNNNQHLTTWFTDEKVDYRWISFKKSYTNESREGDGSATYSSGWHSFYDHESVDKFLTVFDGTGECYANLHMSDLNIQYKSKIFKPLELLEELKKKPIEGFPYDELEKDEKVKVVEQWVPRNQKVFLYGTFNSLSVDEPPHDLIELSNNARGHGRPFEYIWRHSKAPDWQRLIDEVKEKGLSRLPIVMTNYDRDPVHPLLINLKGDKELNRSNIIGSIIMIGLILLTTVFALLMLNYEYPDIFDQIRSLLSL